MARPPDPPDLLAHAGFLKALARGLLRDEHRAEDVVQESFTAALAAGPRREWRAWLGAVVRNLASKVRRGERRRDARERRAARVEALPSAADLTAELELHRKVVAAVSGLDEPYRSAVLLRYFHGLDVAEIAQQQRVSPGTVRARLSRAFAILRARLDRERAGWTAVLLPLLDRKTMGVAAMAAHKKALVLVALVLALGTAAVMWRTARSPDAGVPRAEVAPAGEREGPGEPAAPANVSLPDERAGRRIRGLVVGPTGRPVAGASVVAYPEDAPRVVPLGEAQGHATGGDGRFEIPLEGDARGWTLCASAEGYAPEILTPVLADEEPTLRLDALASLHGRVLDMEGRAIGGALVRWLGFFHGASLVRETRAREDGTYALAVPPPRGGFSVLPGQGGALVEVRAEGYAPLLVEADAWQQAIPGNLEMDLVLVRGATVRGHVCDFETQEPIAGARVVLWSLEGRTGGVANPFVPRTLDETTADADGAFVFEHVPARGFHPLVVNFSNGISAGVGASADGYARMGREIRAPEDGAEIETTFYLWRAAYVRGRVVDAEGAPVAGAEVWASGIWLRSVWPSLYGEPLHIGLTDAQGRYPVRVVGASAKGTDTARILTPGAYVDVEVRAGETVDAPDLVAPTPVPREGLDVLVTDRSGAPVRDAIVWTRLLARAGITDGNGRTLLPRDAGSTETVLVSARGFAPTTSDPVTVPEGAIVQVRVVLPPAARIQGRVVWEDGTPARGALVQVLNGNVPVAEAEKGRFHYLATTETRGDGSFVAHDLPEGPYHVKAIFHRTVGPPKPKVCISAVPTGSTDLLLTLPGTLDLPAGAIEGNVTDAATGKSPLSLRVTVDGAYARIYSPGRFRAEHLTPGRKAVVVAAPGCAAREIKAEVGTGVTRLEVELERGAGIFGRITNATGSDLTGATVELLPETAAIWRLPKSPIAADGGYRLDAVAPGTYHPFVVSREGLQLAAKGYDPIVIAAGGGDQRVDFTVVRGGILTVKVGFTSPPAQEDLATLRLSIEGDGVRRSCAGTYQDLVLPPGAYALRLRCRGDVVAEKSVKMKVGERVEVRLDVP